MRVRIKTWLLSAVGALSLGAVAGQAAAQCNTGCTPPPPPCCQPPPAPPTPPSPPNGCCQQPPPPTYPGGNFNGNFNVNVNVNANANANANANSNSSAIRARGAGDVYINGGGGAYFSVDQPYPTVIQGLNVEGGVAQQMIQQAVQRSRWAFSRVVIQALCIDDRNIPHPASQVQPGRDIAAGYNGELYRCIAGTRLQYTLAEFAEQISFDHGQTMSCQKGESLWYQEGGSAGASEYAAQYAAAYAAQYGGEQGPGGPTGGGIVECRPQTPERDCNERSLLRRYGAGLKILTLWREEIYTEYEQQVVQAASSMSMGSSLTLDGGVGGRVF